MSIRSATDSRVEISSGSISSKMTSTFINLTILPVSKSRQNYSGPGAFFGSISAPYLYAKAGISVNFYQIRKFNFASQSNRLSVQKAISEVFSVPVLQNMEKYPDIHVLISHFILSLRKLFPEILTLCELSKKKWKRPTPPSLHRCSSCLNLQRMTITSPDMKL